MDFAIAQKELEQIRSAAARVFWKEAAHWAHLANDYQSKYSFSSDYDKSYKHSNYARAEYCRETAGKLENIHLPEREEELADCVNALTRQLNYFRDSADFKDELAPIFERLERLDSQA